jgi:hypothetical protein
MLVRLPLPTPPRIARTKSCSAGELRTACRPRRASASPPTLLCDGALSSVGCSKIVASLSLPERDTIRTRVASQAVARFEAGETRPLLVLRLAPRYWCSHQKWLAREIRCSPACRLAHLPRRSRRSAARSHLAVLSGSTARSRQAVLSLASHGSLALTGSLYSDGSLRRDGALSRNGSLVLHGTLGEHGSLVRHGALSKRGCRIGYRHVGMARTLIRRQGD